jgi:hypothetical protein
LALLRELDREHVAQLKTAHRIKKEESDALSSGGATQVLTNVQGTLLEVSENLRTLEVEVLFGILRLRLRLKELQGNPVLIIQQPTNNSTDQRRYHTARERSRPF